MYILLGVFEWDPAKAARNLDKHGVSFDQAITVFDDPAWLDGPARSHVEPRTWRLGRSTAGAILLVVYTVRSRADGTTIRIISARRASRKERAAYAAQDPAH